MLKSLSAAMVAGLFAVGMFMVPAAPVANAETVYNFNKKASGKKARKRAPTAKQAKKGALGLHVSPACGIPVAGSLICSGIIPARTNTD